jgi:hypothetical protein
MAVSEKERNLEVQDECAICISMGMRKIVGDRERERERGKEIGSCDSDNYEHETSND